MTDAILQACNIRSDEGEGLTVEKSAINLLLVVIRLL